MTKSDSGIPRQSTDQPPADPLIVASAVFWFKWPVSPGIRLPAGPGTNHKKGGSACFAGNRVTSGPHPAGMHHADPWVRPPRVHTKKHIVLYITEGYQKSNVHRFKTRVVSSYDSAGGSSLILLVKPSHVPAAAVPTPANVAKSEGATAVAPRH